MHVPHVQMDVSHLRMDVPHSWMDVQELANAGQTKRPTSCLMVLKDHPKPEGVEADESLQELYTEVEAKMKKLDQK
jgi:hypothetical protein